MPDRFVRIASCINFGRRQNGTAAHTLQAQQVGRALFGSLYPTHPHTHTHHTTAATTTNNKNNTVRFFN
jgi:hypothetical protein